jgi:Tfp pilus assembly protein PilN
VIRIDLGKDDLAPSGGAKKGLVIPPIVLVWYKKLTSDVPGMVVIGLGIAVGCLLSLFAHEWHNLLKARHASEMKRMKEQIAQLSQEVTKYTPFQRELKSYEEQKRVISSRIDIVKALIEQRVASVSILDAIGQSLPPRSWISDLNYSNAGETAKIDITGSAYNNEEISDFTDKLSESIYFSDVILEDVGSRLEDKVETKTFQITAKPKVKSSARLTASAAPVPSAPAPVAEAAKPATK